MSTSAVTKVDTLLAKAEATSARMKAVRASGPARRGFTAGVPSNPRDYTRAAILGAVEALEAAGLVADVQTVQQAAGLSTAQVRQGLRQARFIGLVRRNQSEMRPRAWEWALTDMGAAWLARYRYLHGGEPGE